VQISSSLVFFRKWNSLRGAQEGYLSFWGICDANDDFSKVPLHNSADRLDCGVALYNVYSIRIHPVMEMEIKSEQRIVHVS
jgi:hypothetical protein